MSLASVLHVNNEFCQFHAVTRLRGYFRKCKMEGRGRYLYNNIFYIIYILQYIYYIEFKSKTTASWKSKSNRVTVSFLWIKLAENDNSDIFRDPDVP